MCDTDSSSGLRVYKPEPSFTLEFVWRVATRNSFHCGQKGDQPTMDAEFSLGLGDRQWKIHGPFGETVKADTLASEKVDEAREVAAVFAFEFLERCEEGLDRDVRSHLNTEDAAEQVWGVPLY